MHLKAEAGVALGVKEGSSLQATGGVESASSATPEDVDGAPAAQGAARELSGAWCSASNFVNILLTPS
jgi:hypothetical protein